MLLAYGVVEPETQSDPARIRPGLALLAEGRVGVVYEELSDEPGTEADDLMRFGQVIRRLGEEGVVLPIRYGTVVESVADLRSLLTTNREVWQERLRDLAGCAELVVHFPSDEVPTASKSGSVTGTDYLMGRVRRHRHAEDILREASTALSDSARRSRLLAESDDLRIAFLVEKNRVQSFLTALQDWVGRSDAGSVTVTGPWPPFSFVEEES